MADVTTLSFNDLMWPPHPQITDRWPRYVPQIDTKELAAFDKGLDWDSYAIGLKRVFSPNSWEIMPGFRDVTANQALGLAPERKTVLVGYGTDPLVESFWTQRHRLIDEIAQQQWDLVLSPNYSMYGNHPRTEHLFSFRRNLQICVEMREAGIPAVPNLYWYRLEDLTRTASWIADYDVTAAGCNLQTFRTTKDWEQMALPGLTWLAHNLTIEKFFAVGTSRIDRISTLRDLFGDRLHLIGNNAMMYARFGAVMTHEGRNDLKAAAPEAFRANVKFYNDLVVSTR